MDFKSGVLCKYSESSLEELNNSDVQEHSVSSYRVLLLHNCFSHKF